MSDESGQLIISCRCGQKMKVPLSGVGKVYKCVRCGEHVTVNSAVVKQPDRIPNAAPSGSVELGSLGALLVQQGLIASEQALQAQARQEEQGGALLEILTTQGMLDKRRLHEVMTRAGVPGIELGRFEIDHKVLGLVPRDLVVQHLLVPIDQLGRLLTVAMACPLDQTAIQETERATGLRVKAVLSELESVQTAIRKYYPAAGTSGPVVMTFGLLKGGEAVVRPEIVRGLEALEQIPVSKDALARVAKMLSEPAAGMRELFALFGGEAALSLVLLRAANHPAYGLSGQVDNVALALTLLGREGVAGLPAKEGEDGAMNDLVLRARRAAVMAELIAKASGKAPAGTAFTAGLLHGLGSFALAAVDPVSYRQIDPLQAAPAVLEAERRAFGLTFPEVGGSLAARWRLPNGLTQAIRHPFAPDAAGEFRVLAAVTGLAAMVAHAPSHLEPAFLQACGGALGLLGIDAAVVEGLLEEAEVLVTHFEPA